MNVFAAGTFVMFTTKSRQGIDESCVARPRGPVGPVTAEAAARLAYLLQRPFGCGVLGGPARSGKSALLRVLAESSSRSGALTAAVEGQGLDARSLLWELAAAWRLAPAVDVSSRSLTQQVRDFMQGAARAGERLAILVDHADRLDHGGALALARILGQHEYGRGVTVVWSAATPLHGDAADLLVPFTELRIDCPAVSTAEVARLARQTWDSSRADPLSDELAQQIAALSHNDLRRAERLGRLARLAAEADGLALDSDILADAARELA